MELRKPVSIPNRMFFRIGEVAKIAEIKPYVLRYWESEFQILNPQKTNSQQRLYSRSDVETVLLIKHLLYDERFSIEGARKKLAELRKQGGLKEAKKVRVVVEQEEWQVRLVALEEAKRELKELLVLCATDH